MLRTLVRAVIYVRISKDALRRGLGVKRQEEDDRAEAARRGWSVTRIYVDNDVSASSGKPRPAYREMLADIRAGRVDAVIVWDLDRLYRRPIELEEFIDLADQHKLLLANVGGDVDLSTPQGRMIARIKGAVARHEVEQMGRRVKRAQLQTAQQGGFHGGRRPYGYEGAVKDEHGNIINRDRVGVALVESEAAIIREVCRRLLTGDSLTSITADLNDREIPTADGKRWSMKVVREMVRSPRIAGLRLHQGAVIGTAAWPAIIDRDVWEALRTLLTDPRRMPAGQTNVRRYLLSRFAKCGACEEPLRVSWRKQAPSYCCKNPTCRKVRCNAAHLERFILKLVFARLAERGIAPAAPNPDGDSVDLEERIAALEARLEQIAEEFADDPDVTPEQVRAMSRRVRSQLDDLRVKQAATLRTTMLQDTYGLDGSDGRSTADVWKDLTLAQQRVIVGMTIGPFLVNPTAYRGRGFDPDRVDVPPAPTAAGEDRM
jgi:site-specific DNA recombinase